MSSFGIKHTLFVLSVIVLSPFAWSNEVVGTEQEVIEPSTSFVIGGPDRVELWQTFKIGEYGVVNNFPPLFTAIELAIYCPTARPLIEIYDESWLTPVRRSYVRENRQAIRNPNPTLERFELYTPIEHDVRHSYAVRISLEYSAPDETCTISGGTLENSDPEVTLLISDSNQTVYDRFNEYFDRRDVEMAFRAMVDLPSPPNPSGLCEVAYSGASGRSPPELPGDLPVCRCFEDPFLFEMRCGYLASDFFLLSRIPWPLEVGQSYKETWEFRPFKPPASPVKLRLEGGGLSEAVEKEFISDTSKPIVEQFQIKRVFGGQKVGELGTSRLSFTGDDLAEKTVTLSPTVDLGRLDVGALEDLRTRVEDLKQRERID